MTDHEATAKRVLQSLTSWFVAKSNYGMDEQAYDIKLITATIAAAEAKGADELKADRDIYRRYWQNAVKETQERDKEIAQLKAELNTKSNLIQIIQRESLKDLDTIKELNNQRAAAEINKSDAMELLQEAVDCWHQSQVPPGNWGPAAQRILDKLKAGGKSRCE